ncbi:hypothetical protein AFULGI_00006820 [Archaeoglobus fulgidus DSM 8774]|nr:hypothetical protein AFULGI_00006820 [Archaeoglobus fulgidus DSM 8774]
MSLAKMYDKEYFEGKTYKEGYKFEIFYPFHKTIAEAIFEMFKPRIVLDVRMCYGISC